MRAIDIERIKAHGLNVDDFEPKKNQIVNLSREDFNLLDATEDGTIYYIAEENGTVTMYKGDNR